MSRAEQKNQVRCPKCHSANVTVQGVTESETKRRGCVAWTLWIILAVCTFGLILIIPAITNSKTKTRRVTEAICQNCGHRWNP